MKQNNIYLVGFMGCGKTSVLKKIKQKIQTNTHDLDENIENKHGSISKIFESKGEDYFRKIELETFKMLPKNDSIVALGGGSLEIDNIYDDLKNNGFTFYLKDTFENLWNKIQTTERPLVKEGREKIYKLYQSRENRYDQSNYILDISDKKIKSIAEIIIMNSWLKNETI
tara:strand:- start:2539 stop:3048 length:510 start_codon:yes stop_codon:yes gene_type:complete